MQSVGQAGRVSKCSYMRIVQCIMQAYDHQQFFVANAKGLALEATATYEARLCHWGKKLCVAHKTKRYDQT